MTGPAQGPLRILLVEDDPADAELEQRHLRESGVAFECRSVETREAYLAALATFDPHLILTDYMLPGFDGMQALAIARERAPLTPVVIVTGSINEETAVACMKAGATDYVLKGHLGRLAPAVRSAMERRRMVEESARAEEERGLLGAALEQAAEVAIITDTGGTIQYVNPAFERVTGFGRQEAIGKNPRLLKSGAQGPEIYRRLWDTLTAGGVFAGTIVNRRKSGETYVAEMQISPVRDTAGRITHYVCLQRDVTREQDLEEQLRQAQKMEAIGLLAGGIAHDFNNLLSVILTNATLVKEDLPPASPGQGCLTDLLDATNQGAAMVRKLLAFSRRERLSPTRLRVASALADVARTLRRLLPASITVRIEPGTNDPAIMADAGALEQIVLNLATNARDAMPQGGTLTLQLSEVDLRVEEEAIVHGIDQPGHYACVAVTDTGHGMDAATSARAFEPFFTTKSQGAGTGLGLAMVFVVMRQHHGFVHLYSEPGMGTTVRLYFPVATEQGAEPAKAAPGLPRGTETILVVED